MSTLLCPAIPEAFVFATQLEAFFDRTQIPFLRKFEEREQPKICSPQESCKTNLFFGFFFDGTCNNYEQHEKTGEQSNVARLYDIFPGQGVPEVLRGVKWANRPERYNHFFRVYVPGVSSPFDQVEDSGTGIMKTLGGSVGFKGCDRIVWGLIQAINNVNRYFHGRPLISPAEATRLSTTTLLRRESRQFMTVATLPKLDDKEKNKLDPRLTFEKLLRRLHASVAPHWPKDGRPPAKLDPGIVGTIHISIFGFSRGSTQARAFTNWLDSLCRLDAILRGTGTSSLGGFPVSFDFAGLFDTVASVGPGNTMGNVWPLKKSNGHGAWADAEDSLRIPSCVKQCVHLVAGHELRRSFPLDSIGVGYALPAGATEVVFPGVHSDVGGGYGPKQHGKGVDALGADMLSRIPLLFMYKAARLAGVPFKLELADKVAQKKFAVTLQTIQDFNAYLEKCPRGRKSGSLTDIIREQAVLQMAWRYNRREKGPTPLHKIPSYQRASTFEKSDLVSANREYNQELADFEESMLDRGKEKPRPQKPGFDNEVPNEWEEVARYWPFKEPDPVVMRFFDEYVHDSRSAFKLGGEDNEAEALETLKEWSRDLKQAKIAYKKSQESSFSWPRPGPPDYGMTQNQRMAAEAYDRTGKLPVYINEGREPYALAEAGYFRFRKIYGGSDTVLLSNWMPEGHDRHKALVSADSIKPSSTAAEHSAGLRTG